MHYVVVLSHEQPRLAHRYALSRGGHEQSPRRTSAYRGEAHKGSAWVPAGTHALDREINIRQCQLT